ncbi:hypothetical protein ZWY2020_027648 [Hordeum vulgare]|nr:hypothetical protein ZWY2020_027648 [Hordeum vulgare]
MIGVVKNDIVKLFGTIKSYDDGTFYFDEKYVDGSEYKGPITTSASVVRGVTSFANVVSGKLNIPGEKILGLAKFFLGIGLPGSAKLILVPLILSLPSKVLSLTSKDQLKVEVTTVFGSAAPPLRVNLVQVLGSDSKVITTDSKELQFDLDNNVHYLDITPLKIDVGKYSLVFEITLQDSEHETVYTTGGRNTEAVVVTGLIKVDKAEIGISENDAGSAESVEKLDLLKDTKVSLSANHLQKLRLSFQLSTPLGPLFKPHQVFLKLKHESKVEHLFVVPGSARQFKIVLDFLGLVEKFYYLSGTYDLELSVGDASMENSFLRALGQLDLDLPEARKGPVLRHKLLTRSLTCIYWPHTSAFHWVLDWAHASGSQLEELPFPARTSSICITLPCGIGAVLLLYVLFWVKLDLFTTLKYLSFLVVFLVFVGHRTLSHLSNTAAKQKTA